MQDNLILCAEFYLGGCLGVWALFEAMARILFGDEARTKYILENVKNDEIKQVIARYEELWLNGMNKFMLGAILIWPWNAAKGIWFTLIGTSNKK